MKRSTYIIVASVLLAVFGVFSVGVPVVRYLCPMMNDGEMACQHSTQNKDIGSAFTSETPSCCGSYIIAERNTAPYTSVEKIAPQQLHGKTFDAVQTQITINNSSRAIVLFGSTSPPPAPPEPLYIINRSFLI